MACCGDTPTLEILAAVSILREHLPDLKIRVINVVDLMRLQPQTEHPHGLSETDYDALFTKDKLIIFGFHGYPWLVHGLPIAGQIETCMFAAMLKKARSPRPSTSGCKTSWTGSTCAGRGGPPAHLGSKGAYLKQIMKDKLIEHNQYIDKHGEDLPEIRNWKWSNPK